MTLNSTYLYNTRACLHELNLWLTNKFMIWNDDKTQIIQLGSKELSNGNFINLGIFSPFFTIKHKTSLILTAVLN